MVKTKFSILKLKTFCKIELSSNCDEGAVRLVNGSYETEGRLEACTNNIWGAVCATGFDKTDAYVVCNELGLGDGGILEH